MTLEVAVRCRLGDFLLDAAFSAPDPGVTVLFGPSGSGKSSLLAAVAGLLRPERGRVALRGTALFDAQRGIDVPAERRRCGLVFQDARLFPHLGVAANLRYGLRRAAPEAPGPGFEEVVDLLGIGHLLRRRPRLLSGGERQRVALGRALLSRPRLLLMDEPLAGLDGPRKSEVLPFVERLRDVAGLPILYVTHALDEVDRLADTLVLVEQGRVTAAGPVEALSTRTDLPLLAARRDAGAVLRCEVAGHDPARGLTRLDFPGGWLLAVLRPEPPGTRLRLRLRARDVVVATELPRSVSTRNVLAATVEAVAPAGPHESFVHLRVGPSTIVARVTRDAVSRLGLVPGRDAWALIEAVVLDHGGAPAGPAAGP